MRINLLIFQAVILSLVLNLNIAAAIPKAVKGVIDLRGMADREKFIVKLNGEWEFYWGKMLSPDDFGTDSVKPEYFGYVPSYWTDYPQESVKTSGSGYATYRLKVLLPSGIKGALAFDLPVFDTAYDIYVDGRYHGRQW